MRSLRKQIFYRDLTFQIFKNVYEPSEDTFLAADNLTVKEEDQVLDIGTGCGILAILAAQKARKVVAVDLNPHAILCAQKNAEINKSTDKIDVRKGNLFQPVHNDEVFSLIIFNAPYLLSDPDEERSWLSKSWAGGPRGRQLIDKFSLEAPCHLKKKGRILLVQSSLSDIDETLEKFCQMSFEAKVIAEKKAFFETIVLIQASKSFMLNNTRVIWSETK
jgi:release factor glutamine methyltransferase